MKQKIPYLFFIVVLVGLSFFLWKPKPHMLSFRKANFEELPGWNTADTTDSLLAFKISCRAFLRQDPNKPVGSEFVPLEAKDWHPACNEALKLTKASDLDSKAFFQKWFVPVEFYNEKPLDGLFTGYYMPLVKGSLKKTKEFSVPLYDVPNNLLTIHLIHFDPKLKNRTIIGRVKGHQVVPFYTRKEINQGAIKKAAPVIAWINSPIDRSYLEIQGSGMIHLADGRDLAINYSGENGAPYTSIAKVLIDKGVMTRDNASIQHISASEAS